MEVESMEVEPPDAATEQEKLEHLLALLRAVPGATSVNAYPRDTFHASDLNRNGVRLKLDTGDGPRWINVHCNAEHPTKLAAALQARQKVRTAVGEAAFDAVEEQFRLGSSSMFESPPEVTLSAADEQWLAEWYDSQPQPDEVSLEQAAAALATHRASAAGPSATQVLFEAQWLCAKLRAASIRRDRAVAEIARLEATIAERQPEKRPRTEPRTERPPNWEKFKEYDHAKFVELEGKERE